MQFGLPCVASDWRGMSTMIADGETGFLVPVKDPDQLAIRIEMLAKNPGQLRHMGAKAREVFLNNFTDEIWRDRMQDVLRDI